LSTHLRLGLSSGLFQQMALLHILINIPSYVLCNKRIRTEDTWTKNKQEFIFFLNFNLLLTWLNKRLRWFTCVLGKSLLILR
jgi:hypothetical protein